MTHGPRVVSLVPSATETLLEWGTAPIAVTRFCEHPELPAVGGTKNPDIDAIVALKPDLVVMCVEENRKEDAEALRALGVTVHAIDIDTVDDVRPEMVRLAWSLQLVPPPEVPLPDPLPATLRAFVPIWRRPWMTTGSDCYGASILARVGVDSDLGFGPDRYPTVELADVLAAAPDVVLAPDEPYPFTERHRPELEQIAPVVFVDGKDLFWWGTRTPAAVARLGEALAPLLR